ncbi:MAG: cytidine/deoxycytidylate deaminase family protein [Elusimicrobiota bacterium]|nr:cytidine/deoxycytidylate deaminase family protein [Endomicrobiia bacterium]MDW8165260.1 cytidine/deoxycytidylate deaminase family protein [Elusimicrobiota bacterium]
MSKIKRPDWDEYFLKLAFLVAERSTCIRHHVGAVIVRDRRILSTGYNGAPSGCKDCLQLGCLRNELKIPSGERHEVCRAVHAEQNAIIQAAIHGVDITSATMYCTHSPCIICAKMIVNAKIKKFVTAGDYVDESFKNLFKEANIEFLKLSLPDLNISLLI